TVNLGFAAAVNQGVAATNSRFVLLLNPDVRLCTSPEALVQACSQAGIGIAGGLLLSSNGDPQAGFTVRRFPTAQTLIFEVLGINKLFPRNPVNRSYRYLDRNLYSTFEVDQPAGAFLLFRREVWHRLAGFDERFFPVWYEDVDFCRRAR